MELHEANQKEIEAAIELIEAGKVGLSCIALLHSSHYNYGLLDLYEDSIKETQKSLGSDRFPYWWNGPVEYKQERIIALSYFLGQVKAATVCHAARERALRG